ncbi:hypothetical protein [Crassaminicella profunda]|uniref:hypothetical protein n=1 Tax=Crassaminicella profunda TaxID=1286698 RepID=UPI001CA645A3|nr:hypothetical protein [Crassaminicella profunda]QZY55752.1 hypothetical protein K7H06_01670 [Crassaminicella profunda]
MNPNDHTQEVEEAIIAFKKIKRRQLLISIPYIILILAFIVVRIFFPELLSFNPFKEGYMGISGGVLTRLFAGFIISYVIFSKSFWKCPSCHRYLGRGTPKCCPNCGIRLQEE